MTDTEKVMRGLECCIVHDPDAKRNCVECPYNHEGIITNAPCANGLMSDALALLKGQEEALKHLRILLNSAKRTAMQTEKIKEDIGWMTEGL